MSIYRDDRGSALVETAMVSVFLLAMVLGVVEFGNALSTEHTLTGLSREGANLAARGADLDESVDAVLVNGIDVGLSARGGVIGSRLVVQGRSPRIVEQVASPGYDGHSHLGREGDRVKGLHDWGLMNGQTIYVMEVFLDYDEMTPFGSLVHVAVPSVLYERAVF
ncbi:MAG: TadE/TadG family type IV pilus assembly protein [Gemmatimonadota bacterium]